MEAWDLLQTIAEVAIAIAGFSSIVGRDADLGLTDPEDLEGARNITRQFLSTPGGKAWFRVNKDVVSAAYCRFVVAELGPTFHESDRGERNP